MSHYVGDAGVFNIKKAEVGGGLMVVYVYAKWSVPCYDMNAYYEKLAKKYTNCVFLRVDFDASEELIHRFQVSIVPSFLFFFEGKKQEVLTGANSALLRKMVREYCKQQ